MKQSNIYLCNMNDISEKSGRETAVGLTDRYAVKYFVLSDASLLSLEQSLEEPFLFEGFVFNICLNGEASYTLNYRTFTVGAGMMLIAIPGQIVTLTGRSDDLVIESLFLSSDYILQLPLPKDFDLLKRMCSEPLRKVSEDTLRNVRELYALVAKYHSRETPYREAQTKALLFALLMEISSVYSVPRTMPPTTVRQELLADAFFKLLSEHYKTERNVSFYADKLCLTPKYLSTAIKRVTNHPISDWINQMVVMEAKRLLITTDLTALQISERLNFATPSFFGRFFKQHAGVTPLQYKNGERV